MLPPQQGADDNSRPLPAQGGRGSSAGDGFVFLLAVEDQALQSPLLRSAADRRVGLLASVPFSPLIFLTSGFPWFGGRPPRFKTIPAVSNTPPVRELL